MILDENDLGLLICILCNPEDTKYYLSFTNYKIFATDYVIQIHSNSISYPNTTQLQISITKDPFLVSKHKKIMVVESKLPKVLEKPITKIFKKLEKEANKHNIRHSTFYTSATEMLTGIDITKYPELYNEYKKLKAKRLLTK